MAEATSTEVLTDAEWATFIAKRMSLEDDGDVARVQKVLSDTGVTSGRPLSDQHSVRVESVYFAGIKVLRDDGTSNEQVSEGAAEPADVGSAGAVGPTVTHETSTQPFAFQYTFDKSFTVFATEGQNSTGKSAILGVILWGLRGNAPTPTLQGDIVERWLREIVVVYKIDTTRIVVAWRVFAGVPRGVVYAAVDNSPIDLSHLKAEGMRAAVEEHETAAAVAKAEADGESVSLPGDVEAAGEASSEVDTEDDAGGDEKAADNSENPEDEPWPGESYCAGLVEVGVLSPMVSFSSKDQFMEATAATFMDRLELESLPVWQRRPGGVDEHDADEEAHGWNTIAQALVIIDPTSRSVLGEHVMVTNLLLSLYLGSRWAIPTMVARTQKGRADQAVAGKRRRREADEKARAATAGKLEKELSDAQAALLALGDVPDYLDVLAATEQAKADSIAESRAHAAHQASLIAYGNAERELEAAQLNLHALTEAVATRRFWHSLTPSCCPRCDAKIDAQMWAREQEGQCSLCANDFIDIAGGVSHEPPESEGEQGGTEGASGDQEDSEAEIVAIRVQVDRQLQIVEETSVTEDEMRLMYDRLRSAAAASAAAVEALDRTASTQRHELELAIVRLEARIDERAAIDSAVALPEEDDDEFVADVLRAALAYATTQRDVEQRLALAQVSAIITELGIEFGVRNLVSAKLGGNGHLPVVKGETKKNFSDIAPGERLRLRIALIVGLLRAGRATGTSRHPGLLIIDDLTSHEISHEDASSMARALVAVPGLQIITASTYADTLTAAIGDKGSVVRPDTGTEVMF